MRWISWLAAKPVSFSRTTLLHAVNKYLIRWAPPVSRKTFLLPYWARKWNHLKYQTGHNSSVMFGGYRISHTAKVNHLSKEKHTQYRPALPSQSLTRTLNWINYLRVKPVCNLYNWKSSSLHTLTISSPVIPPVSTKTSHTTAVH